MPPGYGGSARGEGRTLKAGPKREIDIHPDREKIVKALVEGRPYGEIVKQHGTSKASLSRYMRQKLMPQAAEAMLVRDMRDAGTLLEEIGRVMERVQLMYDACDEYLRDPVDPRKYTLGPRAEEITVSVLEDLGGDEKRRRSMDLQALIDEIRGAGKEVLSLRYKHADPRKLLLDAARTLNQQLELLARIQGQIKDVTVNITNAPVWIQLQQLILDATKGQPEVRKRIADGFAAIGRAGQEPGRDA